MKRRLDFNRRKEVNNIYAGEFYVTTNREAVITTLLGSCVAVCLLDEVNSIYGMNHFMLPTETKRKAGDKAGKYGVDAMRLLLAEMLKQGAKLKYLKAKLFGGGKVTRSSYNNVPQANIKFAQRYLAEQGIPVTAQDVGGECGRQIYFIPKEGVYSRKLKSTYRGLV
ncbi:MAG: chemotaxis protein CheD [Candidatus Frackibacter sp. T328-2]|nr:MAG: chemotaxis protein CheD [Candidatus Frackibacter sp. T328-2]